MSHSWSLELNSRGVPDEHDMNSDKVLLAIGQHQQKSWARHESPNFNSRSPVPPIKKESPGRITREETAWDHLQRNRQFLPEVLNQYYGSQAREIADQVYGPNVSKDENVPLIDEVLAERNRDFAAYRQEQINRLRDLNAQRQRLLQQQEQLRVESVSPASSLQGAARSQGSWEWDNHEFPSRESSPQSVHGVDSFIRITNDLLPANIAKYNRLRAKYEAEYDRLYRPYNGELGPQTYAKWQMEDYYLARSIVDELVEKFLNMFFRSLPPAVNKAAAEASIAAESREWKHRRSVMTENRSTQLIMEELILEVTGAEAQHVIFEFMCLRDLLKARTDKMLMTLTETVAVAEESGRHHDDPAYNLVTKTYFQRQRDRDKFRANTWCHMQHLHLLGPDEGDQEEIEDDDLIKINFFDVTPMDLRLYRPRTLDSREEIDRKATFNSYQNQESQYWKGITASVQRIPVAKKASGVFTAVPSPNHRFLGLGTVHGDIIIYDIWNEPWRPLYCIHNRAKYSDAVVDLAWSADATRIISVQRTGVVRLWSLQSGVVARDDLKGLEIKTDIGGIAPEQLYLVLTMDMDNEDFMFQSGALSEMGALADNYGPTWVSFHPNFTAFAKQHCFCVSLDNGDILKCDSELATQEVLETEEDPGPSHADETNPNKTPRFHHNQANPVLDRNLVGQDVEADLLRQHRHPILLFGYLENMKEMVSVDLQAYINIWGFARSNVSNFGWFKPKGKYKLEMSKMMYSPVSNIKPNVIFSDRSKASSQVQKTRQQISIDRTRAQKQIDFLKLKDPWHQEYLEDQDILTQIYKSDELVSKSGAIFHVIMMHSKTGQLSTYLTRVYKPVKVKSTKLLSCKLTPSGGELIFCLLFPEYPPKGAHISVVIVDLHVMDVRDFRLDIPLTEKEYNAYLQQNIVSCDVSRPLGVTGSMYVFINIAGKISGYSLNTGVKVLSSQDPRSPQSDFVGCLLNSTDVVIRPTAELTVVGTQGKTFVIAYSKEPINNKKNFFTVVRLTDHNEEEQRKITSKAFNSWKEHPRLLPPNQRVDPVEYELEEPGHPAYVMRNLLLEIMDEVIQDKTGTYSDKEFEAHVEIDRTEGYMNLKPGGSEEYMKYLDDLICNDVHKYDILSSPDQNLSQPASP